MNGEWTAKNAGNLFVSGLWLTGFRDMMQRRKKEEKKSKAIIAFRPVEKGRIKNEYKNLYNRRTARRNTDK